MLGWLINLVIGFAIRQLAKFGADIKWELVKADWGARLAALIPGDWFDAEAVFVLEKALDVMSVVLSSAEVLEKIVDLVKAKDLSGAIALVKELIMGVVSPGVALDDAELFEAVKSYKKASA